jgi:hypothetical protein
MSQFFGKYPTVAYNINKGDTNQNEYVQVVNLMIRTGFLSSVINGTSVYYDYLIKESDRPEIIADKFYGDPEAHWMILLANNMVDPHYDWPLDSRSFQNYIINKYGSIEAAELGIHHYEQVITRTDSVTGNETVQRIWIDYQPSSLVYGYFDDGTYFEDGTLFEGEEDYVDINGDFAEYFSYDTMAVTVTETYNLPDGSSCIETIERNSVSFYDWENEENEKKRAIKLIRPEYWPQIKQEFEALMIRSGGNNGAFYGLRSLR